MPRPVEIKPLEPVHVDAVVFLEARTFSSPFGRDFFEYAFEDARTDVRVALLDGRVVGYVSGLREGDTLHIAHIATDPQHRRKGVGLALMESLFADTPWATNYRLEMRISNTEAHAFYSRLGFTVHSIVPKYYEDSGEDALVMVRV